jgi:putative DNA primase/helicase
MSILSVDPRLETGTDVDEDFIEAVEKEAPKSKEKGNGEAVARGSKLVPPADLAEAYKADRDLRAVFWRGDLYRYTGTHYTAIPDGELRVDVIRFLQDGEHRKRAGIRLAADVVANLHALVPLPAHVEPPALIDGTALPFRSNMIPMRNGIFDVGAFLQNRDPLVSHGPEWFTTSVLPFAYDPDVGEPKAWHRFLDDLFDDDVESREALQETFGYLISSETRFQKIFLIVGPKRSGKTTIAKVLTALSGAENVVAPTLASMERNFGLQSLIGKRVAIIGDARLGSRADQAVVAERLLSISGEDGITVDRKHLSDWTGRLSVRFLLLSNELPRIIDSSGALASRFIIFNLTESFFGREDHGLSDRLLGELPQIGLWSFQGLRRLHERGRFVQPSVGMDAVRDFEDLGSPISAFIRDRCEIATGHMVDCGYLYEEWRSWCKESGRDHPGTAQTFGRDLRSAFSDLKIQNIRGEGGRNRMYSGIGIKTRGGK